MDPFYKFAEVVFQDPDACNWKPEHEVHLWLFPAVPVSDSNLTAEEKALAARFRFEGDRNRFTTGRHVLRLLLARYLTVAPSGIILKTGPGRKPELTTPQSDLQFNISHSGDWVLLAFADSAVGVDIEFKDPIFAYEEILGEHFSPEEKTLVLASNDSTAAFFYLWTRKEALTKAWGTGLQENLKEINVLDGHALPGTRNDIWSLQSFSPAPDYISALAFSSRTNMLLFFNGANFIG